MSLAKTILQARKQVASKKKLQEINEAATAYLRNNDEALKEFATALVDENLAEAKKPIIDIGKFVQQARDEGCNMLILETPRNTGKSTGGLKFVKEENDDGRKFVWIRGLQLQAEASIDNFITRYGELGYTATKKSGTIYNAFGDEAGYFIAYKTRSARSGQAFNDQRLGIRTDIIVYDEFNEIQQSGLKTHLDQFKTVIQLVESIQRDNPNAFLLLIGNRDTSTNKFVHNLGLKPNKDFEKTYIDFVENEYGKCMIARVGKSDYRIFRPKKSISAFLASFDKDANRYINEGGYLDDGLENVLNYKRWIAPTFNPLCAIIVNNQKYTLGEFEHYDNGKCYALCLNCEEQVDCIAFDSWSDLMNPSSIRGQDTIIKMFAELIFETYKNRTLYLDEFETLDEFQYYFD